MVCAILDLDKFQPQTLLDVLVPGIVILPAYHKSPPHLFFSAVAKVFTLMEWVRVNAGRKFEWGEELPQFDSEEKRLFRDQIKEREEAKERNLQEEL